MLNFGGGMLTGSEIYKQIKKGNIEISPFDKERINPNSYNLRLHDELLVYRRNDDRITVMDERNIFKDVDTNHYAYDLNNIALHRSPIIQSACYLDPLDMKKSNDTLILPIPDSGLLLHPGVLYIGRTIERTASDKFIPMINGRSSGGRLGISIHICAGFGDIGFDGTWTLEISVVEPIIIYPNVEIAQVSFFKPYGDTKIKYNGRYQYQKDATASRFHRQKRIYEV